jgi:uncharacterized protein HemY
MGYIYRDEQAPHEAIHWFLQSLAFGPPAVAYICSELARLYGETGETALAATCRDAATPLIFLKQGMEHQKERND